LEPPSTAFTAALRYNIGKVGHEIIRPYQEKLLLVTTPENLSIVIKDKRTGKIVCVMINHDFTTSFDTSGLPTNEYRQEVKKLSNILGTKFGAVQDNELDLAVISSQLFGNLENEPFLTFILIY
jgi:hypothetical protein